jgi:hypothetical protein
MAVGGFYWNDSWLHAAAAESYKLSVAEAAAVARSRAPWAHVAASISPTSNGIRVGASDAALAEKGAGAHVIEPSRKVAKFSSSGDFATGPIKHPGFGGTPFMQPAAEAWPSLFVQTAKRVFPG